MFDLGGPDGSRTSVCAIWLLSLLVLFSVSIDGAAAQVPRADLAKWNRAYKLSVSNFTREQHPFLVSPECTETGYDTDPVTVPLGACFYRTEPNGTLSYWSKRAGDWRRNSNCYCYALNVFKGGFCIPGITDPAIDAAMKNRETFTCDLLRRAVSHDGAKEVTRDVALSSQPPTGHYIALMVRENACNPKYCWRNDFHAARKDADGFWTWKEPGGPASDKDLFGNKITDPSIAVLPGHYDQFCGFWWVDPATMIIAGVFDNQSLQDLANYYETQLGVQASVHPLQFNPMTDAAFDANSQQHMLDDLEWEKQRGTQAWEDFYKQQREGRVDNLGNPANDPVITPLNLNYGRTNFAKLNIAPYTGRVNVDAGLDRSLGRNSSLNFGSPGRFSQGVAAAADPLGSTAAVIQQLNTTVAATSSSSSSTASPAVAAVPIASPPSPVVPSPSVIVPSATAGNPVATAVPATDPTPSGSSSSTVVSSQPDSSTAAPATVTVPPAATAAATAAAATAPVVLPSSNPLPSSSSSSSQQVAAAATALPTVSPVLPAAATGTAAAVQSTTAATPSTGVSPTSQAGSITFSSTTPRSIAGSTATSSSSSTAAGRGTAAATPVGSSSGAVVTQAPVVAASAVTPSRTGPTPSLQQSTSSSSSSSTGARTASAVRPAPSSSSSSSTTVGLQQALERVAAATTAGAAGRPVNTAVVAGPSANAAGNAVRPTVTSSVIRTASPRPSNPAVTASPRSTGPRVTSSRTVTPGVTASPRTAANAVPSTRPRSTSFQSVGSSKSSSSRTAAAATATTTSRDAAAAVARAANANNQQLLRASSNSGSGSGSKAALQSTCPGKPAAAKLTPAAAAAAAAAAGNRKVLKEKEKNLQ